MKKLIVIVILVIAGVFVFRYLESTTDKKSALERYQKDMEMPYLKLDAFFNQADLILATKNTSNLKKDIKETLIPNLKAVENDMAMISSKDEEVQKLHGEFLANIKKVHKALNKAVKGKTSKAKQAVGKQAKAMTNYYNEHKGILADLYQKYDAYIGNTPEPSKEPTKYDEYDKALESAKE